MLKGALYRAGRPPKLALLKAWGKVVSRRHDPSETVCIFSSGRGGSTWLADVFCASPGTILQYEPFHSTGNPTAARFGIRGRPHFTVARPPSQQQKRFIRGLVDGSFLNFETATNHQRPVPRVADYLGFRRFVLKFISGNFAMDWITAEYGVKAVHLLRHPCAVVASQLQYGDGWRAVSPDRIHMPESIYEDFPRFREIRDGLETTEEALAFVWAVEALVPLGTAPARRRWQTVFYEDLADDPVPAFENLFEALNLRPPADLAAVVSRPSHTVTGGRKGVAGWREFLSADQADRILAVTRRMGADFYDRGDYPLRSSALVGGAP